jgi:hypothetical protein
LSSPESALLESTEVLDTLPIGVLSFGYEPLVKLSRNAAGEDDSKSIEVSTIKPARNGDAKSTMVGLSAGDNASKHKAGQDSHGSFHSLALEKMNYWKGSNVL